MSTILLIDDSEDVRHQVAKILSPPHTVFTAESWSSAFAYLSSESIDLILLDVNLPGLQGDEIVPILKGSSTQGDSPMIVLFSSLDSLELRKKAREAKADDSLQKTLDPVLLKFQISKLLRRRTRV